jgi:heme exporter protein C
VTSSPAIAARPGHILHRFANPGRFLRLAARVQPWLTGVAVVLVAVGLGWGLFIAPADRFQHDAMRIIYVHVPAAWLASAGYFGLAVCSALRPLQR